MKKIAILFLLTATAAFATPYFQVLQLNPDGQSSSTIATVPVPASLAAIETNYPTATSIEFRDDAKGIDKVVWTAPATTPN